MKTLSLIFVVTMLAMLACVIVCAWLANNKHARYVARKRLKLLRGILMSVMFGIEVALGYATEIRARWRHRRIRFGLAANIYTGQDKTHTIDDGISRYPDAAITLRFLIYKKGAGTNAPTANQSVAAIAAQTDYPIGSIDDQWETPSTFSAADSTQPVALKPFGGNTTRRLLANASGIGVGVPVYSVAGGYVDIKANLTTSSTAYMIGYVIDVPGQASSSQQGDTLEVATCVPILINT